MGQELPPIGGLINVYKPRGFSSFQMVAHVRRVLGIRRIGHGGTLDPFAEGVLPIVVGRSTRLVDTMESMDKVYRVVLVPGADTETQDLAGAPVRIADNAAERLQMLYAHNWAQVRADLDALIGVTHQEAPIYSAVKVDGRPLYEYARRGLPIPPRPVRTIEVKDAQFVSGTVGEGGAPLEPRDLEAIEALIQGHAPHNDRGTYGTMDLQAHPELPPPTLAIVVDFTVSKGTYIRTLCQTLGAQWGVGAYAYRLQRLRVGPYVSTESLTPERVTQAFGALEGPLEAVPELCPPAGIVSHLPVLELTDVNAPRAAMGQTLHVARTSSTLRPPYRVAACLNGTLIGLMTVRDEGGETWVAVPERMIATREDLQS